MKKVELRMEDANKYNMIKSLLEYGYQIKRRHPYMEYD